MTQIASKGPYTKGLHDLGYGCYGWLQPDGSWGWSNAGLVVDSGESLLVDTLFDLKLTAEMLAAQLNRAVPDEANVQPAHPRPIVDAHLKVPPHLGKPAELGDA